MYKWVDESGTAHFATDRDAIPRRFRDSAVVIKPPPSVVGNPSAQHAPPPRPAPPPQPPPAPAAAPAPAPATPVPAPAPSAPGAPPDSEFAPPPVEAAPAADSAPAAAPEAPAPALPTPHGDAPPAAPHDAALASHDDPRKDEIADLEDRIEKDRETLRQLISTPRWDSAELASDPRVREIAARLPRMQAELAALRNEAGK